MSVEIGQLISGKVTGITNFGAFVTFDQDQSGLVHISEVSNQYVKDINDFLTVGDEVTVKVLKITDDGKINLSLRQAQEGNEQQAKPAKAQPQETSRKPRETRQAQVKTHSSKATSQAPSDFDEMMSQFLKDSESRLSSLKRNTEGKRGGRGGRRT